MAMVEIKNETIIFLGRPTNKEFTIDEFKAAVKDARSKRSLVLSLGMKENNLNKEKVVEGATILGLDMSHFVKQTDEGLKGWEQTRRLPPITCSDNEGDPVRIQLTN